MRQDEPCSDSGLWRSQSRRMVLVDDPEAVGEVTARLDAALGSSWEIAVVTAFAAIGADGEAAPDLVLFEPLATGGADLGALDRLRVCYPEARVAALSRQNSAFATRRLLRIGLHGYLLKDAEPPVLRAAIELILAGGVYLPPCLLDEGVELPVPGSTAAAHTAPPPGSVFRRVLHPDGRVTYDYIRVIRPDVCSLDEETLRGPNALLAAMHPADRPIWRASVRASADNLTPLRVDFRLADRHGRYLWYRSISQPSRGDGGTVIWDGYCTELGPDEPDSRIESRESRFRGILDRTFQFIGLLSPEGLLLEVNRAALDFTGLTYTEVIGKPYWELRSWNVTPRHREELRAAVQRAARGAFVRYEAEVLSGDDRAVAIDFSLKPVRDDAGRVTFLIAEGRDITSFPADNPTAEIEGRLTESGQRLATIVANLPGAVFRRIIDRDGQPAFLYYSRRLADTVGLTPDEVLANPAAVFERIHPDDRPGYLATIRESHRTLRPMNRIVRMVRPSGEVRWLRVLGQPWRTPEGEVVTDGLAIDITEQHEAEERLRQSERSLAAIAANLPGVVFQGAVAPDGKLRFTYVSPNVARVAGITPEVMIAEPERWLATIHPEDRERYRHNVYQRTANPAAPDHEFRVIGPDGTVRCLRSIATTWRRPSGEVIIDGIVLDITEQREAEARLRERERVLTTLTDNLPAVVMRCLHKPDSRARCAFVTGALEKLTGLSAEGLLDGSTPISSRIDPDDRAAFFAAEKRTVAELSELDHEFRLSRPDGEVRWLRWIGRPSPGSDGEVFIDSVMFDVTERRQAFEELDRRNRDLVSLCRISEIALKSVTLDAGLCDIVAEIGRFTGFDTVAVALYDEARQIIDFRAYRRFATRGFEGPLCKPVEQTLSGVVIRTGQMVAEHRCLERTEPCLTRMHELGHQTFFGVPIRVGPRVIGCFSMTAAEDTAIDPRFAELVSGWADYIASFIASQGRKEVQAVLGPERHSTAFEAAFASLTARQRDVLAELATGRSNRDIAAALGLQEATVKIHVRAILKALGAANRTHAASIANAIERRHRRASWH